MKLSKVPDSSPGPYTSRLWSGRLVPEPSSEARACPSAQLFTPCASGPMRAYRSPKVTHSTGLSGCVITAMPSMPTRSSIQLMLLAAQSSASESLIAREAAEMSVSPVQNSLKPSPVPGPSTVTSTPGSTSSNSSATRTEIGSTVEEPEIFTSPVMDVSVGEVVTGSEESSSPPQAAATRATIATRAKSHLSGRELIDFIAGCPPYKG